MGSFLDQFRSPLYVSCCTWPLPEPVKNMLGPGQQHTEMILVSCRLSTQSTCSMWKF